MQKKRYACFVFALLLCFSLACDSDDPGEEQGPAPPEFNTSVLMCGRSVMAGWFGHWGYNGSDSVSFCGYALHYGQMTSPPNIVESFRQYAQTTPADTLFFKLCFVDFCGGSQDAAQANLERNKSYVPQVHAIAQQYGKLLIYGNALPVVRRDGDGYLVWNQQEYNRYVAQYAAQHSAMEVLNLYDTLAGADGYLLPEYAVSESDSHLNDQAYTALDAVYCTLLTTLTTNHHNATSRHSLRVNGKRK